MPLSDFFLSQPKSVKQHHHHACESDIGQAPFHFRSNEIVQLNFKFVEKDWKEGDFSLRNKDVSLQSKQPQRLVKLPLSPLTWKGIPSSFRAVDIQEILGIEAMLFSSDYLLRMRNHTYTNHARGTDGRPAAAGGLLCSQPLAGGIMAS